MLPSLPDMRSFFAFLLKDIYLFLSVFLLLIFGIVVLNSLDKPIFPSYLIYVFGAILIFIIFSQINFEIVAIFSKYFYIISIFLLLLTDILGQVTRGTVRWLSLGSFGLQTAEIVRPFLLVFFANYLSHGEITLGKTLKALGLLLIPVILILIQPSLSVSILTFVGFVGVALASKLKKKYILMGFAGILILLPLFWQILAPYQKQRILTFINPGSDPQGSGYNSLQSTIAAGSGKILGTGLGKGVQTQLAFLPEKQTDFIFAAVGEELGFIGSGFVLVITFIILLRLIHFMENSVSPAGRAYISGFFLIYLVQVFIHTGMNMGLLPVTGLPYPLLSAGGSSLLGTMIGLGIALGAYKR